MGALVATACGASDSNVDRGQFASELVHAVCDTVIGCCDAAELGFNATTCRQSVLAPFGAQPTAPGVRYDAAEAARCIDASNGLAASCQETTSDACANVFRGEVPPGGGCQASFQCDPGPLGFAVCGVDGLCTWPARGGASAPCAYSCRSGAQRSQCRSVYGGQAPVQTACWEDDGLFCFVPPDGGQAATCQPINSDCRQRLDVEKACPPGGYCDPATGACVGYVPIGGNCAASRCGPDGFCGNGVCYPRQPVTAPCRSSDECLSNRCKGGFCTTYSVAAALMCAGDVN